MSGLGDERLDRGYRAANDTLDERPSAATRASILAAAARQVQAGPRDAQALRRVPRAGAMLRWPMAAAAAVLLSTLAVMMAVRTEREMPSFSPPAEIAEPRASTASDSAVRCGVVGPSERTGWSRCEQTDRAIGSVECRIRFTCRRTQARAGQGKRDCFAANRSAASNDTSGRGAIECSDHARPGCRECAGRCQGHGRDRGCARQGRGCSAVFSGDAGLAVASARGVTQ